MQEYVQVDWPGRAYSRGGRESKSGPEVRATAGVKGCGLDEWVDGWSVGDGSEVTGDGRAAGGGTGDAGVQCSASNARAPSGPGCGRQILAVNLRNARAPDG